MNYIKMKDLKPGYLYKIDARNASYGIWLPQRESFLISRIKFGENFLFEENHWDCKSFATAKPLEEIEEASFNSVIIGVDEWQEDGNKYFGYRNEDKILAYLNSHEGERKNGSR